MRPHEYIAGRRFTALKSLSLLLNTAVVVVFFFIYRFLIQSIKPGFSDTLLLLIFLLIEFVVVAATLRVAEWYAGTIYYLVDDEGLAAGRGKRARFYRWEDFTEVREQRDAAFRLGTVLPVTFVVKGEVLRLNQYTSDIYGLAAEIYARIEDHVEIPEVLWKQAKALREGR